MDHDEALYELQRTLYTSKNPTRRWLHVSRREWITSAIRRSTLPDTGAVMEVGPGSGVYLPTLAASAAEVVATDIEDAYLSRLEPLLASYPNIRLVKDDITRSNLSSSSFDLILCTEVIEHIRDSRAALAEMRRLLRPDGTLILSTPQRYSPLELCAKLAFLPGIIDVVRLIYREPILETGHINLMTKRTLHDQLNEAGFCIRETYTAGMYLPIVAEAFGNSALAIEKALERRLRNTRLEWLLWTQSVVAAPR
jgi:ubiquinone/menaquinone biosynthesis C-methylase UbiE